MCVLSTCVVMLCLIVYVSVKKHVRRMASVMYLAVIVLCLAVFVVSSSVCVV